jgi:hypothetical protein
MLGSICVQGTLDIFLAKPKIRKKSPQYGIIPYCRDEKTYFRGSTLLAAKLPPLIGR